MQDQPQLSHFDAYGQLAKVEGLDDVILSGRNAFYMSCFDAIIEDILGKLTPKADDHLLDLGCNVGLITRRLAPHVHAVIGQDHPDLLARFAERGQPANVTLLGGFWPETRPEGQFDCILSYGVMYSMPSREAAMTFVRAAADALAPGGRCLIGEFPNGDSLARFRASPSGAEMDRAYAEARALEKSGDLATQVKARDDILAQIYPYVDLYDDRFLLDLVLDLRQKGFDAWLLPQGEKLPINASREDLLIRRRK